MSGMLRVVMAWSCAACWTATPPTEPAARAEPGVPVEHASTAMIGPAGTLDASCAAIELCPILAPDLDPPDLRGPECPAFEDDDALHFTAGDVEVGLAPVACERAPGGRSAAGRYHAFVKRADGWYRSGPLFAFEPTDTSCHLDVRASREARGGSRIVMRVRSALGCASCNEQGERSAGLEFLVVIDPTGATPHVYPPIAIGQHYRQTLRDDGDPAIACPVIDRHVVLTPTWTAAGDLVLAGASRWQAIPHDPRGIPLHALGETGKPAPTPVGTHRFKRGQ